MSELLGTALEFGIPLLGAALAYLGKLLADLIRAKVKHTYLQGVLVRLDDAVVRVVRSVEQTAVRDLRIAKGIDSDGGAKITKGEAEVIRENALAVLKSMLGKQGLTELGIIFGLKSDAAADAFLRTAMEAEVSRQKDARAPLAPKP